MNLKGYTMDFSNMTAVELNTYVDSLDNEAKDELRAVALHLDISFSGNTGANTLRAKIKEELEAKIEFEDAGGNDDPLVVESDDKKLDAMTSNAPNLPPVPEEPKPKPKKEKKRRVLPSQYSHHELMTLPIGVFPNKECRRAAEYRRSMELVRVKITNLDPADAALEGGIYTVVNSVVGKVSKMIPYGDAGEAFHIPRCLLDALSEKTFVARKPVGRANYGIKKYKSVTMKKFMFTELPPLTQQEIDSLAKQQAASGAIDN